MNIHFNIHDDGTYNSLDKIQNQELSPALADWTRTGHLTMARPIRLGCRLRVPGQSLQVAGSGRWGGLGWSPKPPCGLQRWGGAGMREEGEPGDVPLHTDQLPPPLGVCAPPQPHCPCSELWVCHLSQRP